MYNRQQNTCVLRREISEQMDSLVGRFGGFDRMVDFIEQDVKFHYEEDSFVWWADYQDYLLFLECEAEFGE